MNFTARRTDLTRALDLAARIATKKSTIPILSHALLTAHAEGGVTIAASDNAALWLTANAPAKVAAGGCVAIPASELRDIIKACPGDELVLSVANHRATIVAGRSRFTLAGLAPTDFPKVPAPPAERHAMPGARLLALHAGTTYAASTDESRYHLAGVLLEANGDELRAVATDGHRLATCVQPAEGLNVKPAIIPAKGMHEIASLLEKAPGDCEVGFDSKHIYVTAGGITVAAKFVDAQFPPWEQTVPKSWSLTASIDRAALMASLARVKLLAGGKVMGVTVAASEAGSIGLATENADLGSAADDIDCELTRTAGTKGGHEPRNANVNYLLGALAATASEKVELRLAGELDPITIVAGGQMALVMPMRG